MKKRVFAVVLFFVTLSIFGQSKELFLDEAIKNASLQIQDGLNKGSTIIVYQFQAHDPRISDYVLKELFDKLVNLRKFVVLDRGDALKAVETELNFQYVKSEGMISDDSLASITKRLGAQAIVTGYLDETGNGYRFRIRVIGTETTAAIVSYTVSVNKNDRIIASLSKREPNAGEKLGTGVLNILLGLGSYIEGDVAGGLTLTAGYAVAAGLFVVEAVVLDWDSPAVGIPGTVGFAVAGVTIAYGFARPFIYHHAKRIAEIMDTTQPKIILTSDHYGNRNIGFQISYTVKF